MMKGYKKLDQEKCAKEKHELKSYFKTMTVSNSRMAFKMQNYVVPTIRLNFKSDKKFKAEGWLCPDCRETGSGGDVSVTDRIAYSEAKFNAGNVRQPGGYLDSQEHVLKHCTNNEELRKGKNLESLEDCVSIFRQVISRRSNKHSSVRIGSEAKSLMQKSRAKVIGE